MKNRKAPDLTPTSDEGGEKSSNHQLDQKRFFINATLDMSWQLAAVVLIPVIAGVELDKRYHTAPTLTLVGLALAIMGVVVVTRRVLKEYSPKQPRSDKR